MIHIVLPISIYQKYNLKSHKSIALAGVVFVLLLFLTINLWLPINNDDNTKNVVNTGITIKKMIFLISPYASIIHTDFFTKCEQNEYWDL